MELELRHQSREVLTSLALKPSETVTRELLIADVWSGRNVSADSVAHCIAEIRRALDDGAKRIIETVPREGYRLILPESVEISHPRQFPFGWQLLFAFIALAFCAISFLVLRPTTPSKPPVIAVLPFEDFSSAPHQGYLSDAVSESVIIYLARYPQLTVISRRSSFQFRKTDLGISEIASRLRADFVLEGSQKYDGSRLRITAQLIDRAS
ncbi:winged helix-turn-helix domain-containing protein [Ruegeria sp. Alg231-54]|uniref:winged helix-turn-helix domain-containing protein n=1 Tax=Ruegeria sp. Alg231-54 TaxID=1922221 RepID=UPI001F291CB9|nr:winged helix-turn-helix domain-containing protein [Ruegeria sp. Alg231-54]